MTDANKEETSRAVGGRRRLVLRRSALFALAVAVVIVIAIWFVVALSRSNSDSVGRPGATTADTSPVPPERQYSDNELGLDQLISNEIVPFDAQFRTFADWEEPYDERQRYFEQEAIGHERERMHFENNLALVFWRAYENLPPELGLDGTLDRAYDVAMAECADAAGWPGLRLNVNSRTDVDQVLEASGITYESFLDLRHECAKQAVTYPTLDPAVRDELLARLAEHYRQAVYEYLREFPDAEVPLVEHEGSPRPLEERLVKLCLKTPDPTACAAENRVELPAEAGSGS